MDASVDHLTCFCYIYMSMMSSAATISSEELRFAISLWQKEGIISALHVSDCKYYSQWLNNQTMSKLNILKLPLVLRCVLSLKDGSTMLHCLDHFSL